MKNYAEEVENRVAFIRSVLEKSHSKGIVFGNSGGKDSALVGILCKKATDNVLGVIMPCISKRNYTTDADDGKEVAEKFGIETVTVDLTPVRNAVTAEISKASDITDAAGANIAPRLRMTTLYAIAQSRGALVAGTGNRDEFYMGYFTKWGDGAFDLNPISDLTVGEVYELLEYLGAPESVIKKAPSAALYEGQTDEKDMGVTYAEIDAFLRGEKISDKARAIIESYHERSAHKRAPLVRYRVIDD